MGYTGVVQFANFPVSISNIGVTANSSVAALHFDLNVNLMEQGFSGTTSLSIVGKFNDQNGLHRWKYDHLDMDRIAIDADLGKVQIKGLVDIKKDDPVYGNGFYGELGATFNGIAVNASAWFGRKDYRYWFVDAYADLSGKGIPLGPLEINGFGGGAYYHMTKSSQQHSALVPSGQSYVPDGDSGMGFRALLGFALPKSEKAFNGKVGFEMAFNRNGGINKMLFFGEAHIVKPIDFKFGDKFKKKLSSMEEKINALGENNRTMQALKEANLVEYSKVTFPQDGLSFTAGIDAHFGMEMDFRNNTYHAEMEVFVNTPGGFFQGVGPNGRAGWVVFHASPREWYLNVGTPKDRIGLKLGIGNLSIKSTSYLMVGDRIGDSPPPPPIVANMLGADLKKLDYMRDLNALGDGRGFAFGADFSMDTGNMSFLVFYARFRAGMGFDLMIKNYGEAACKGSGPIGINGWYANGQAYAFLQGELGINVKLLFVRKRIPIVKTAIGALLQAKLPNPAWFRGYLGGEYNLLGGLVRGTYRFKVELGKECELIGGSPLGGLKVIAETAPNNGSDKMDVFTVPQTAFNMRIDQPFELEDDTGTKTYRILLNEYAVTKAGVALPGTLEWNENHDAVNFVSRDILPPNSKIDIKIIVSFQEKKGGTWVTLNQDGKVAQEIEEVSFSTGDAPDYIPLSNIAYCYPLMDQQYLYQSESRTGYVYLVRGQPYLFSPKTKWTQKILFNDGPTTKATNPLQYDRAKKRVFFQLPQLENQREYALRMLSYPPQAQADPNAGRDNYRSQETGQEGTTIEIRNRSAQALTKEKAEVELLAYTFKTSKFNTFAQKLRAMPATKHYLEPIYSDVHALQANIVPSERFGIQELVGSKYSENKPLVRAEAILDDAYYTQAIYPLIYKDYPLEPRFTVERNIQELGLPPRKAVQVLDWYPFYLENRPDFPLLDTRLPYRYYLPYYYKKDFVDIQYKVVNAYLNLPKSDSDRIRQYGSIIGGIFPSIRRGGYRVTLQYMLPGELKGSTGVFKFNNPY